MNLEIKKNDIIEIAIDDVTIDGNGIGRWNNIAVFVPKCAVGDKVLAKIIKVKSNYLIGKLQEIINYSPDRISIDCPVYSKCGGCAFRHISYEAELKIKQKHVKDCLARIGGFKNIPIQNICGASERVGYRNKAQVPVGNDKEGSIISGFYALHSHNIMPCENCRLHPKIFDKIISEVKLWMEKYKILPYDEKSGKEGTVRHIYLRCSKNCEEIMVCIVINKKSLPFSKELIGLLTKKFENIKSIITNYNSERTNVILGKKFQTIWGKSSITDTLCGMKFKISPESFYQVNHDQTEILYTLGRQVLDIKGNETLLDLYCGIGTIGLTMSSKVSQIIGAEIVEKAVLDARENALLNNVANSKFICSDSKEVFKNFSNLKIDAVILDPPRKGCSESVLKDLIGMFPEKILYISCNPATLAKDLKVLCEEKYKICTVIPVDLFPRTPHVETVVLLGRKMVDDRNIEYEYVDYEPKDNEYMRNTKGSATYAEIKSWIKKQYNVSVSNLYIAQCKDECGFEKRENYNTGAEGHKVPQCPDEKRKMIMEAFKHFRMI